MKLTFNQSFRRPTQAAMTLVELMFAVGIASIVFGGFPFHVYQPQFRGHGQLQ
jgi:hypothetical protein